MSVDISFQLFALSILNPACGARGAAKARNLTTDTFYRTTETPPPARRAYAPEGDHRDLVFLF